MIEVTEPHNRVLTIGAVSLTRARVNKQTHAVLVEILEELDQLLHKCEFVRDAPFNSISMIVRWGLQNDPKPQYQRMNKKYQSLDLSIEIDIRGLDKATREVVYRRQIEPILRILILIGEKYGCPTVTLRERLESLPPLEKCEGSPE